MMEPVEYLAYVYYRCSHCGETGDEVRLRETKSGIHICMFCGNEDKIKPITGIDFKYSQHKESKRSAYPITLDKYDQVVKSIMSCGWGKKEASAAVTKVLDNTSGDVSVQELFRLAIIELDEKQQQPQTD